jgi:hypothetical protein
MVPKILLPPTDPSSDPRLCTKTFESTAVVVLRLQTFLRSSRSVCALALKSDVAGFLKPCMKPDPPHLDLLTLVHKIHTAVLAVHLQTRNSRSISRSKNANAHVVLLNGWRSNTTCLTFLAS